MKVIYVVGTSALYNGGSNAFLNMLERLVSLGVQPLVILPSVGDMCELLSRKGIPIEVLTYRMNVYPPLKSWRDFWGFLPHLFARIWVNLIAVHRLYRIAKDFDPEIIHTNVSVIDIGYRVARQLKIPHIWHVREYGDKDFSLYHYPTRSYFLNKLRKYSYAICITKDIQKYFELNDEKSCVIYDGVLSERQMRFNRQKNNYFLFAGRLEPAKGIQELLNAFADFCLLRPNVDVRLKIAGDTMKTNYRNLLIDEVKRLKIEEKVDFLGVRKDVLDLMEKAYLMIVPSRSEGFGFITTEAQFNGALVLGRDTAGTKEQFDNGLQYSGEEIALRFITHQDLIQAMCDVVDKGIEYYFPMIKRSQEVIKKMYTTEYHAQQVYDFYANILENKY